MQQKLIRAQGVNLASNMSSYQSDQANVGCATTSLIDGHPHTQVRDYREFAANIPKLDLKKPCVYATTQTFFFLFFYGRQNIKKLVLISWLCDVNHKEIKTPLLGDV